MTRLWLHKPGKLTASAATFAILYLSLAQSAAWSNSWRISLDGGDVTGIAVPIDGSGEPLVNLEALGPVLGLSVQASDGSVSCTDRAGNNWQAKAGSISMETIGKSVSLSSPAVVQAGTCYIPAKAVAEMVVVSAAVPTPSPPNGKLDA